MLAFTLVVLCQIGSPQGVRLLDDAPSDWVAPPRQSFRLASLPGPALAQAPSLVPPMVPATEAQVSAAQLQVDIEALRKMRPSVGGGIALVASGGTAAVLGGLYLGIGAGLGGFAGAVNPFFVLGAIGLGIGAPLILIGVWLLWNRIEERARIDDEMKNLRLQLQQARPPPRPTVPIGPPPPSEILPPPQVLGPENSIQLAAF